jgi:hypothetical protein
MQQATPVWNPWDRENAWHAREPAPFVDEAPRMEGIAPDVAAFVRKVAARKGSTFSEAVNRMLRLVQSRFESLERYEKSKRCDACGRLIGAVANPKPRRGIAAVRCECPPATLAAVAAARPRPDF